MLGELLTSTRFLAILGLSFIIGWGVGVISYWRIMSEVAK